MILTLCPIVFGSIFGDRIMFINSGATTQSSNTSSGTGDAIMKSVTQSSHNFSVGNTVYNNGSLWKLAISNSADSLGWGVVSGVTNNTFNITFAGYINGLSGLTEGSFHFVSDTEEGNLSITEGSSYSNPILFANSSTDGYVFMWRASEVGSGGGSGDITSVITDGPYLYGGATSGAVNLYLNETELNATIDARATGGSSNVTTLYPNYTVVNYNNDDKILNVNDTYEGYKNISTTFTHTSDYINSTVIEDSVEGTTTMLFVYDVNNRIINITYT